MRRQYPFEFALEVEHRLLDSTLQTLVELINEDERAMPASFGFHPAFRWPMAASARETYCLVFDKAEAATAKRVNLDGQLEDVHERIPLDGDRLALSDQLFEHGAWVLDPVASEALVIADDVGSLATVRWAGCTQLGLWSKPGAPFFCVEPWAGYPTPKGSSTDLFNKPGAFLLQPGASRRFSLIIDCAGVERRGHN